MSYLPLISFFSGFENAAGKFENAKIMIWGFKITESPDFYKIWIDKGSDTEKILVENFKKLLGTMKKF